MILAELHGDHEAIAASLLHEVINFGGSSEEEIADVFGPNISKLVSSISKINKLSFNADSNFTITYYKKDFSRFM